MTIDYGKTPSSIIAHETDESAFSVQMHVSGHALLGDEPDTSGSKNLGPNPYDFLLAALASCTVMTVRWYAKKEEWPLEDVEVKISHSKVRAADAVESSVTSGTIDVFEKTVKVIGYALSAKQKSTLEAVAHKCPVHKTLQSEVIIRSTEV